MTLHTLTTVREAHELPLSEAVKAYPIHLHGVVTFYDPYNDKRHAALFVHDATGTVYVKVPHDASWPKEPPLPGSIVDIQGVSAPGDYASLVDHPHIKILGRSTTPITPKRVSLTDLMTGVEDSQWVEIEGLVQSSYLTPNNVILEVATSDGVISAMTVKEAGVDYSRFIDTRVTIRGNASALFNSDRQLTGFRLMFPDIASITVIETAPPDPFSLPIESINNMSRFRPGASLLHRVHLRGTVTLQWPGRMVCFQDGWHAVCAQSVETAPLPVGQLVDVVGFVELGGYRPTLVHALFRPLHRGDPQPASLITVAGALRGMYDDRLVKLKGTLIGHDLAANDETLLLATDGVVFAVVLPLEMDSSHFNSLKIGSELEITGICSVEVDAQKTSRGDGSPVIDSFRILLPSAPDLVVLKTPSWWTAAHSLVALGVAILIAAAVLGWVVVLRKRVEEQTKMLRESEERFRHMAQHDALTGLPNRTLLHDRLRLALERGKLARTSVAVLMVDLDNFKWVNDSYGHEVGDQTLRITAQRILAKIRGTDTVARMGGDEFIVLLTDLTDSRHAERIAADIVAALAVPLHIAGRDIPVSASVGIRTVSHGETDAEGLLRSVDAAMYRAKARGRNCFEVSTGDLVAAS